MTEKIELHDEEMSKDMPDTVWLQYNYGWNTVEQVIDGSGFEYRRATPTGVEVVTFAQLVEDNLDWRLSKSGTFGAYLMAKYPHGIKIVP